MKVDNNITLGFKDESNNNQKSYYYNPDLSPRQEEVMRGHEDTSDNNLKKNTQKYSIMQMFSGLKDRIKNKFRKTGQDNTS